MFDSLKYFFEPSSVVIIGASGTPGKAGYEILVNMQANGYAGRIFPVNPGGGEILGLPVYRSVQEILEPIDLAVFIVPAEQTLGPLRECAAKGVRAAVISSGGFAEVGDEGARMQEKILAVARSAGMRIIGPNTIGLISTPASFTTTFYPLGKIRRGPISYVAQTGVFAGLSLQWILTAEKFGVARVAGLGNKIDVDDAEVLDYLGQDPETKAVLMYVEGFRQARRFFEVAREVTKKKPVIVFKGGRTKAGAERAMSHTASLSGNDAVLNGAFRQAGIARLERYADLIDIAKAVAFQPLPRGRRIASLAQSGGLGVIVADACETAGLQMACLSLRTVEQLGKISFSWVKITNPVDMTAIVWRVGPAEAYRTVLELLFQDEGVDVLAPILLASPRIQAEQYSFIPELMARFPEKPIYVSFTGEKQSFDLARSFLETHSVPVFASVEEIPEKVEILCRCREVMERK
jgi:acetate---CoA ligase (ADP-forming)